MLRCRPSEITLAPSDIAYAKRRFALQQVARKDRSTNFSGVLANRTPRIRRGPQRSRDEAITHPHGIFTQKSSSGPGQYHVSSAIGNTDGAGDMCSPCGGSGPSLKDSTDEKDLSLHSFEKHNGAAETERRISTSNVAHSPNLDQNAKAKAYNTDLSVMRETDDRNESGLTSDAHEISSPKATIDGKGKSESTIHCPSPHYALSPIFGSAEVSEHASSSTKIYVPRSNSTKTLCSELFIAKRAIPPQLRFLGRPSTNNSSGKVEDFQIVGESSSTSDVSDESRARMNLSGKNKNSLPMTTCADHAAKYKHSQGDTAFARERSASRRAPVDKFAISSHSNYDFTALRLSQCKAASYNSLHCPEFILDPTPCGMNLKQKQRYLKGQNQTSAGLILPQGSRTGSLEANFHHDYPPSCPSSRHSSYASISNRYGLPRYIPARRSSLDTLNATNVSSYGRSCSCSSPNVLDANADVCSSVPNPPRVNRNRTLKNNQRSSSSAGSRSSSVTRLSSISEAPPEALIHLCSPLEQIQHYCVKLGRNSESISQLKTKPCFSEADRYSVKAKEEPGKSHRVSSDPICSSTVHKGAFGKEGRPNSFSKHDHASERDSSMNLVSEQTPIATTTSTNIKDFQSVSADAYDFPSHTRRQRRNSSKRKSSSYSACSPAPSDPFTEIEALSIVETDGGSGLGHSSAPRGTGSSVGRGSSSSTADVNNNVNHLMDVRVASDRSQISSSLPWHLSDAHLQQENRGDEDEEQMRMALRNMQIRAVGNIHAERMDETPPREGRIERFLRA